MPIKHKKRTKGRYSTSAREDLVADRKWRLNFKSLDTLAFIVTEIRYAPEKC
jgi:hypothetical protein